MKQPNLTEVEMKNFSNKLITELEEQLENIKCEEKDPIKYSEQAINCTILALEKLKSFFKNYKTKDKKEEIEFFKEIKPKITSKLIYYNDIYTIEINKPTGDDKKQIKNFYKKEIRKRYNFFSKNAEIYKYFRTNNTYLDKKYFIIRKYDIKLTHESYYFQSDYNFTTSHDYLWAKIIANEKIIQYLKTHLNKIVKNKTIDNVNQNIKWTASKVALVELIYALHNERVINNGEISLNELVKVVEALFNTEIKQHNRIFLEIRNRKTIEKTNFLKTIQENLNKKIIQLDQ